MIIPNGYDPKSLIIVVVIIGVVFLVKDIIKICFLKLKNKRLLEELRNDCAGKNAKENLTKQQKTDIKETEEFRKDIMDMLK